MDFSELGLSAELVQAVADQGYREPTPIQQKAIPPVLAGEDLLAAAQTGTGKTAAFVLPMLHRIAADGSRRRARHARTLILTPTRELAIQVHESVVEYGAGLDLSSAVIFGGVKAGPQIKRLSRGVHVLVATPGRLLDLHGQGELLFDGLDTLVLDEADRMLDMGFIHDLRRIVNLLPKKRQTLMFSATFSGEIRKLASSYLRNPKSVDVAPANSTAERIEQRVYPVDKKRKGELLSQLIRENGWHQVLVFSRTKHGANKLARLLEQDGINAGAIHGNKSQNNRQKTLESFRNGKLQVMVATDIAARGLDIEQLPNVVNFDLPHVPEDYVHRIGRTARAGASGRSHSLVCADEVAQLFAIERLIRQTLPREEVEGFEPVHALPEKAPRGGQRQGANNAGANNSGNRRGQGAPSGQRRKAGGGRPGGGKPGGGRRRRPRSGNG